MKTVEIDLGIKRYNIVIGAGLLSDIGVSQWLTSDQVVIVTNEVVAPLYLETLSASLADKKVVEIILPDGESTKNLSTIEAIFDQMIEQRLDRTTTAIALGGGVIGDMTGFVAACYQRGIPFIQIPTTLLAQVDSSVGGKTGVNHPKGKNMIGAFYQPQGVLADIATLKTLDDRQFSSGMAEVIKYGLINDLSFFNWLEGNIQSVMDKDTDALEYIIEQSCLNKASIVQRDEREQGVRALLNLGHTFGHAIETATNYVSWLHGEAVGLGMMMAAYMSHLHGWLNKKQLDQIKFLLEQARLPVNPSADFSAEELLGYMQHDKKVRHAKIRFILIKNIGESVLSDHYNEAALHQTLKYFARASR